MYLLPVSNLNQDRALGLVKPAIEIRVFNLLGYLEGQVEVV
jgi:hypothetical protein